MSLSPKSKVCIVNAASFTMCVHWNLLIKQGFLLSWGGGGEALRPQGGGGGLIKLRVSIEGPENLSNDNLGSIVNNWKAKKNTL